MKSLPNIAIVALAGIGLLMPELAFAGPFTSGASSLSSDILTILTPVAVIAVMVAGALAWFGRISWVLAISVMVGIVLVFGSQQIVAWVRGLFGV
ncbi:MAG: TrbC/VirB2 family protein [Methyloglobulus sp.]|nr:TrbC/VirB2 family protein [Methyloglobulus sp.]